MKCTSNGCGGALCFSVNPRTVWTELPAQGGSFAEKAPRFQTVKFMSVISAEGAGSTGVWVNEVL